MIVVSKAHASATLRLEGQMELTTMTFLCALGFSNGAFGYKDPKTLDGQIMDRQCALMHSHETMMKAESATNEKECTLACVKNGDRFAFLDSSTNAVYVIEDEKKVRSFAGQRVHITGSIERDSEVLQIKTIAAAK
jgi:uncharacterized protein YdeI (BOF family)